MTRLPFGENWILDISASRWPSMSPISLFEATWNIFDSPSAEQPATYWLFKLNATSRTSSSNWRKIAFKSIKKSVFFNIFEFQPFFIIFLEVYQIQLPIISLFHPLTQKQRYYHRNWISQQIFQQNDQSEINAFCQFSHSILKVCDQNCMLTVGYPKDKILSNKKYKITIVSKVKLIISPQCSSNV